MMSIDSSMLKLWVKPYGIRTRLPV